MKIQKFSTLLDVGNVGKRCKTFEIVENYVENFLH